MNRLWVRDFLYSFASGLIVMGVVLVAGGPAWAAIGFGLVLYLLLPPKNQLWGDDR